MKLTLEQIAAMEKAVKEDRPEEIERIGKSVYGDNDEGAMAMLLDMLDAARYMVQRKGVAK